MSTPHGLRAKRIAAVLIDSLKPGASPIPWRRHLSLARRLSDCVTTEMAARDAGTPGIAASLAYQNFVGTYARWVLDNSK